MPTAHPLQPSASPSKHGTSERERVMWSSIPLIAALTTSLVHSMFAPRFAFVLAFVILALFGCAKEEDSTEQRLSRADKFFAESQYVKAEQQYRDVLRLAPNDPTAIRQLAMIYYDQGQLRQAYPLLKQALDARPDDLAVQLKLGITYFIGGDYEQAWESATQIFNKQPGNDEALMLLVDAAHTPEKMQVVEKLLENLRERDQNRPGYHLALGALDLRQNDGARAESEFKEALRLDPKSSAAYMALGNLYWRRQDLSAAEQSFKTAVDFVPPQSPIRIKYVDFKLRTGSVGEAKTILEDIYRKLPDYLIPRVYLMKIACTHHQDDDCSQRVQNILAQDSLNFDALFQSGSLNLATGEAEKAIRDFEQLGDLYPQNPQVRYQLARAYLASAVNASEVRQRNLVESAENNLTIVTQLDPHLIPASLLLAELKIRKGNFAAAVDLLVPVTKEQPQIVQGQYLLASAYLGLQKVDQALAIYRQMTEAFPQDPVPPFLMGSVLLAKRQQAEARDAFEKSVEIAPSYLPAVEALVNLDILGKQYSAAVDQVQKLIDKEPNQPQLRVVRAKVYSAERDFPRAEADLAKAIELDPHLELAHIMLAQLYVESNRQGEAIEKLRAFTEKSGGVGALLQLAGLYEKTNNFAAAAQTYEKLLAKSPNFGPALNNLAVISSEHLGQVDKGYGLAKRARESMPNEPQIADTLGWILFKKGDYVNSLPLLQEGARKLPHLPESQFHLGMAYYMLGQEASARSALQKAVQGSGDFLGKDEARRRLAVLDLQVGSEGAAVRTQLNYYMRQDPNDPAALTRLAELEMREGSVDKAVRIFEKVAADYPMFAPATRQLALLYGQRLTDSSTAYDVAMRARQAYPADPDVAKAAGILSYRRGNFPQSVELFKEASAKRNHDSEVLYYLGETYRQLNQWNDCKESLHRALVSSLAPALIDSAKRALADCTENSSP
jgi:tetratricopeptide (TPR) repeat protein